MAQDASKVRVALAGRIIVQEENGTVPASIDTPVASGTDLGYTTEDGVTFTFSKETDDLMGWPAPEPLRKLLTASPKGASFVLRQLDRATWLTTMGGTITSSGTAPNIVYMWEPDETAIPVKRLYVEFEDGDLKYRFGFRRAQQTAEVEMNLVRTDAVNLPNEWSALATSDGAKSWFMQTNDPAFAA